MSKIYNFIIYTVFMIVNEVSHFLYVLYFIMYLRNGLRF